MNTKIQIEKLNKDSYFLQSTQIKLVLESKGLWKYVTEITRLSENSSAVDVAKFVEQRHQAMAEIMLTIEPIQFASVANLKTPKQVWKSLENMYRSQCIAHQSELRRNLLTIKNKESQSIQEFVNEICDIENRLAMSGYTLNSEDKRFALLEGLPDDYEMLKTVLEGDELQNFEAIVDRLLIREDQIKRRNENVIREREENVFMERNKKKRINKNILCHYCHKKSHPSFKCFQNPESNLFREN